MSKFKTDFFDSIGAFGRIMLLLLFLGDAAMAVSFACDGEWMLGILSITGDIAAIYAFFFYIPERQQLSRENHRGVATPGMPK